MNGWRLKRTLDRAHKEGCTDGFMQGRHNPGRREDWTRFHTWAYEAGFAEGTKKRTQLCDDLANRYAMSAAEAAALRSHGSHTMTDGSPLSGRETDQ